MRVTVADNETETECEPGAIMFDYYDKIYLLFFSMLTQYSDLTLAGIGDALIFSKTQYFNNPIIRHS